jgi:hypothetical protein
VPESVGKNIFIGRECHGSKKPETGFSAYWPKLTIVQKASILKVAIDFADANEGLEIVVPVEPWQKMLQERGAHYTGIKEMAGK